MCRKEKIFYRQNIKAQGNFKKFHELRTYAPWWLLFFSFCFFSSCHQKAQRIAEEKQFDCEMYFASEALRLQQANLTIKKTVLQNTSSDQKTLRVVNWKKELEPFIQCNINKPSLANSYVIDSSFANKYATVKYTARDNNLPVKAANVYYLNGRVMRIHLTTHQQNMLYSLSRNLKYIADSGYSIESTQKIIFKQPETFSVQASWQ